MALQAIWQQTMDLGGCWLVEVDIRKYFDTLDHAHLRALLRQRVRDGVLLRLIDKWLSAGVLDDGELTQPEAGTPQSSMLRNSSFSAVLARVCESTRFTITAHARPYLPLADGSVPGTTTAPAGTRP